MDGWTGGQTHDAAEYTTQAQHHVVKVLGKIQISSCGNMFKWCDMGDIYAINLLQINRKFVSERIKISYHLIKLWPRV